MLIYITRSKKKIITVLFNFKIKILHLFITSHKEGSQSILQINKEARPAVTFFFHILSTPPVATQSPEQASSSSAQGGKSREGRYKFAEKKSCREFACKVIQASQHKELSNTRGALHQLQPHYPSLPCLLSKGATPKSSRSIETTAIPKHRAHIPYFASQHKTVSASLLIADESSVRLLCLQHCIHAAL